MQLICARETVLARIDNESRSRFGKLTDPVAYTSIEWPGQAGARHFALTVERLGPKNVEPTFLVTLEELGVEGWKRLME